MMTCKKNTSNKLLGKTLSLLLSLLMVVAVCAVPMSAWATVDGMTGSGTQEDPFIITTAEQLAAFAEEVDNHTDGNAYEGQYVKLGADIDLSAYENWNPIGIATKYNNDTNLKSCFWGDFDGAGHTISNLTIKDSYTAETNVGLFSILGNTARIHDLKLTNVDIEATVTGDWKIVRAGGIAGITGRITTAYKNTFASGAQYRTAIVDSCSVDGKIVVHGSTGQCFSGGIIGQVFTYGAVVNCLSKVNVETETSGGSNAAYAGGLIGMTGNESIVMNNASFGNAKAINKTSTNRNGDAYAASLIGMAGYMTANNYAAGNATIVRKENSATAGKNVGVIAGQATGGMCGDFNYYNSEAVLTIENADGTEAPAEDMVTRGIGMKIEGSRVADTIGKTAEELQSADFVKTLRKNIDVLNRTMEQNGEQDLLKFRGWERNADGAFVPTGAYLDSDAALKDHSLVFTEAKDATCTKEGNIAYWTCKECGKIFADEEGTKEISADETVLSVIAHIDSDNDGKCDSCETSMNENKSGNFFSNIWQKFVGFIQNIFSVFARLFGRK